MTDPTRRLAPVVRLAPAKVNLTLAVLGRRADGFHDLHMVVAPLGLADRLSLAVQPLAAADSLHSTGFDPGPPEANLVLRALARARRSAAPLAGGPAALPPLAVRLEKRIPVAAGLGGGSSDAAAAIGGALEAWAVDLPPDERRAVAASVGSDAPFFLAGGTAVVEGRGERVTPLRGVVGDPPGVLLVTPSVAVSTADAFALFAAAGGRPAGATRLTSVHLAEELGAGLDAAALVARAGALAVANDLAPVTTVLVPGLLPFRRALMRLLRRPIGQSGSGPTLWALYPSVGEAQAAADGVRRAIEAGDLVAPGERRPFVEATALAPADRRYR